MTEPLLAAAAGLGFGVFQTLNRRAVGGMSDAYLAFLQLLVALAVLTIASLATEDLSLFRTATTISVVYFALAGLRTDEGLEERLASLEGQLARIEHRLKGEEPGGAVRTLKRLPWRRLF